MFYSDGIAEARNAAGQEFGLSRLVDFIIRHTADGLPAPETLRRLVRSLLDHHLPAQPPRARRPTSAPAGSSRQRSGVRVRRAGALRRARRRRSRSLFCGLRSELAVQGGGGMKVSDHREGVRNAITHISSRNEFYPPR
ncbi:hypothetical protein ACIBCT_18715 [Streptosporangium sp. NPDC050855]|uniref:hypothetical protein n=1 Tax=Streptosporangium sp. NPDC050855 TaxID=3366194 RepID=UPI0037BAEC6C